MDTRASTIWAGSFCMPPNGALCAGAIRAASRTAPKPHIACLMDISPVLPERGFHEKGCTRIV